MDREHNEPTYHNPVMLKEVIDLFRAVPPGWIVDATHGGGGHTRALLAALPEINVLAVDRDPDAAAQVQADPRLRFIQGNFGALQSLLSQALPERQAQHDISGFLFDLGVSSHQLDVSERGFSYHRKGPLDMRMGPDAAFAARDVVNGYGVDDLARIFHRYGEERFARRIAAAIVARRPIDDTATLSKVVAEAVPAAARRRRHPARRVFQALRIEVNGELQAIETALDVALESVRVGGRVVVMAYHSLEDRIVKRRFATAMEGCTCPPEIAVCVCGKVAHFEKVSRKPLRPSEEEVLRNPRARSAVVRGVERVAE